MDKEFLNPPSLPNWQQAFSQIVIVKGSAARTIYVAGQVSVDQDKHLIGAGDLKIQAAQALKNVEVALAAAGATTADVVQMNIYVKDYKAADAATIGAAIRNAFPGEKLPASTWLGVASLAEEEFLIEVDAVAVAE